MERDDVIQYLGVIRKDRDRLRAENERLNGLLKEYQEHAEPYWNAEVERLKAFLTKIMPILDDYPFSWPKNDAKNFLDIKRQHLGDSSP